MSLPEPPRPDQKPAPPPRSPAPRKGFNPSRNVTIAIVVGSLIVLGLVVSALDGDSDSGGGDDGATPEASGCEQPATAWLDTLQSAFYNEYRNSAITSSAYVEAITPEGTVYYVAVNVDGVAGTAVFGTSDPPLQSDPGLIAGANPTANQLSDLGIDIPEDSPAGVQLLDDGATSAAESCL